MRNVGGYDAAAEQPPGARVYAPGPARRARRRKQAVIGVVGLLTILGVGGIVANQAFDDPDITAVADAGNPVPTPVVTASAAAHSPATRSASPSPTGTGSAHSATPRALTTQEQIAAVRSLAARPNNRVRPGLPPNAAALAVDPADVTTVITKENGEDLKTVSARQDLTGYQELSLAADEGTKYGATRCTKTIRVSPADVPRERPTFLLCWRTSAAKSVFTVAVKRDGRPSSKLSLATIDKRWSELG